MAVVEARRRVKANKGMVWGIVADLAGDAGKPPGAKHVEILKEGEPGLCRRIVGTEGHVWQEECVGWQAGKLYSIDISGDFPISGSRIRYTCSLAEDAGTILIRLYFDFAPRFGFLGRFSDVLSGRAELRAYATELLDNWVRIIHAREWVYRVTARGIIEDKGGQVHAVTPETSVREVSFLLREKGIGSALVLNPDKAIAGVVSERDIVRGLADADIGLLEKPVADIMTTNVIVADPDDNMMSVMACMSERRIRHLPVVENGRVLGLISIGDVIKARVSELEGQSETLLDYIDARRWHELYKEVGPAAYAQD